jgi:glucuronate isomerase
MDRFLNADFLLSSPVARTLFHDTATHAPIVDVHNHLPPLDIEGDRTWTTLTELWLDDDHYKWRAMRHAGVDESHITGEADPWDKFQAWAVTLQRSFRNPLYVWSHLELRRVFGIDIALTPSSAREIWDEANRQLPNWSAQTLLRHFGVRAVATTDDPADTLAVHARHAEKASAGAAGTASTSGTAPGSQSTVAMLPTFRPDAAHRLLDNPTAWSEWAQRLTASTGVVVDDLDTLLSALTVSYARFASMGGRASDHGLASIPDRPRDAVQADRVVRNAIAGKAATIEERNLVLLEVVGLAARLAHGDESVLQVHLGPLRNVSP